MSADDASRGSSGAGGRSPLVLVTCLCMLVLTGFPDGVDPVWMDNVQCGGSEAGIASCPFNGWNIENCSHVEDVGLNCTP